MINGILVVNRDSKDENLNEKLHKYWARIEFTKKKKKIQIENPRKHNLSKSMKDLNQFKKKFNDYNLEKIY